MFILNKKYLSSYFYKLQRKFKPITLLPINQLEAAQTPNCYPEKNQAQLLILINKSQQDTLETLHSRQSNVR